MLKFFLIPCWNYSSKIYSGNFFWYVGRSSSLLALAFKTWLHLLAQFICYGDVTTPKQLYFPGVGFCSTYFFSIFGVFLLDQFLLTMGYNRVEFLWNYIVSRLVLVFVSSFLQYVLQSGSEDFLNYEKIVSLHNETNSSYQSDFSICHGLIGTFRPMDK